MLIKHGASPNIAFSTQDRLSTHTKPSGPKRKLPTKNGPKIEIKQDPDSRSTALGVGWLHDEEYNLTGTSPQPRIYPRGTYGEF